MADNVVYLNDGTGRDNEKVGSIGPVVQGSVGTELIIDVQDLEENDYDIDDGAVTAVMQHRLKLDTVYAVSGTLADDGNGDITWTVSSGDVGTPGTYYVLYSITKGGVTKRTFRARLDILPYPGATAIQNEEVTGVSAAAASYLEALEDNALVATAGNLPVYGADTHLEDSGFAPSDFVAVAGDTIEGAINFDGNELYGARKRVLASSASGATSVNMKAAGRIEYTLTGDISLTLAGKAAGMEIILTLIQGAGAPWEVTSWPAGTEWTGGAAPTMTTTEGEWDRVHFEIRNDGTTPIGTYLGSSSI